MDGIGPLVSLIFGVGSVAVAALVAVIVGRRRGLDQVEDRADGEIKRLVEAQAARMLILEAENKRLAQEVTVLTQTVADLRRDLEWEKRITARIRQEGT